MPEEMELAPGAGPGTGRAEVPDRDEGMWRNRIRR